MILTDFSGTLFATLHTDIKYDPNPTKNSIRGMCLNTIRAYNKQFRHEYGEMMIILDEKSWRETVFPQYKWVRRNGREEDTSINWDEVWEIFNEVVDELIEHMPYRCIRAKGAEADDIIGFICRNVSNEKILIVSNDKDMGVLTSLPNVTQYRPFNKQFFELDDPYKTMFELILTGDKDDGIPNIKCDDTFYIDQYKIKQTGEKAPRAPSITQKFKDEAWEVFCGDPSKLKEFLGEFHENFERNTKLIDLLNNYAPKDVVQNIQQALANSTNNGNGKMIKFFQDNHLQLLSKYVEDFYIMRIQPTLY